MTHTRLRKFNTQDTYPEQNLDNDLCQAVIATGATVFLRGQVAQDLETRESLFTDDAGARPEKQWKTFPYCLGKRAAVLNRCAVWWST